MRLLLIFMFFIGFIGLLVYGCWSLWQEKKGAMESLRLKLQKINSKIATGSLGGGTFLLLMFMSPVFEYLILYALISGIVGSSFWYLIYSDKDIQAKLEEENDFQERVEKIQIYAKRAITHSSGAKKEHWRTFANLIDQLSQLIAEESEHSHSAKLLMTKWVFSVEPVLKSITKLPMNLEIFKGFDISVISELNAVIRKDIEKLSRGERINLEINTSVIKSKLKQYLND